MDHIEANHITGISILYDLCGKSCKSRNGLAKHKSKRPSLNSLITLLKIDDRFALWNGALDFVDPCQLLILQVDVTSNIVILYLL